MKVKSSRPASVQFHKSGIYVAESLHADDFRMEPTVHAFGKILYIGAGEGTLVVEGKSHPLRAGRMAVVAPRTSHYLRDAPGRPLSLYFLCVRDPLLAAPGTVAALGPSRVIRHATLCETTRRLLQDLLYEQTAGEPGADLVMTGRVLELFGLLLRWKSRRGGPEEPPLRGAMSRARMRAAITETERYFYRPQSLERTAAHTGLKPRRFSQLFREITLRSWPAFLREKRIHHAKRLLAATNRSIIAVCFECGFEDVSSFYRAFHRIEATSPLAWRKRHRPGTSTSSP
jgi:AraC family L-rhamnose operon regulatory protein RhaS